MWESYVFVPKWMFFEEVKINEKDRVRLHTYCKDGWVYNVVIFKY